MMTRKLSLPSSLDWRRKLTSPSSLGSRLWLLAAMCLCMVKSWDGNQGNTYYGDSGSDGRKNEDGGYVMGR